VNEHQVSITLDDQAGGWVARCTCGWSVPRASWYKARALKRFQAHLEEARRWGALPMGEPR
jgi:hypothetical protein